MDATTCTTSVTCSLLFSTSLVRYQSQWVCSLRSDSSLDVRDLRRLHWAEVL
jgi:hypothetical protein